jgi:hypothetical protein
MDHHFENALLIALLVLTYVTNGAILIDNPDKSRIMAAWPSDGSD